MKRSQSFAMLLALGFATVTIDAPAAAQDALRSTANVQVTAKVTATSGAKNRTGDPNAIATQLAYDPEQKARVEALLPRGMTLERASAGFRNQWQLIAALHASHTQKVPFQKLQTALTVDGMSLGEAIRQLKGRTTTRTNGTPASSTTTRNGVTTGRATGA
jgi:hypothetical protein